MPKEGPALRRFKAKRKALTIAQIFAETGKINLTEAHRRHYPNQSEKSHDSNCTEDMGKHGVWEYLEQLVGKEEMGSFSKDKLLKNIAEDITLMKQLLKTGAISKDEAAKFLNTLQGHYKLQGMALGVWRADKPQNAEETDPNRIYDALFSKS